MCHEAGPFGLPSLVGARYFVFCTPPRPTLVPTQLFFEGISGVFYRRVKWLEREVKNERNYTLIT
jgi:hypothetical protein